MYSRWCRTETNSASDLFLQQVEKSDESDKDEDENEDDEEAADMEEFEESGMLDNDQVCIYHTSAMK